MAIIVSESDEIRCMIGQEVESKMRSMFREFGITGKTSLGQKDQLEWLPIEQAKQIVPIKSKKKWKELRDFAQVNFVKVGKGFRYEKNSLNNYLINNSTITKPKRK